MKGGGRQKQPTMAPKKKQQWAAPPVKCATKGDNAGKEERCLIDCWKFFYSSFLQTFFEEAARDREIESLILLRLSCSVSLFWLRCPDCPVLFWLACPDCPVLFWLACPDCPVLFWLACPSSILAVLSLEIVLFYCRVLFMTSSEELAIGRNML